MKKVFNVLLPEFLHNELKLYSIKRKKTMNDIILAAVEFYIDEHDTYFKKKK